MIYQFDSFTLNTRDYLFKNGDRIESLEPRVFDLLAYLIQHSDRQGETRHEPADKGDLTGLQF
jgi:DNA-binding winged helix-turn-helix (wHTH) protein